MSLNIGTPNIISTLGPLPSNEDAALLNRLAGDLASHDLARTQLALELVRTLSAAQLSALLAMLDDQVLELLRASLLGGGSLTSGRGGALNLGGPAPSTVGGSRGGRSRGGGEQPVRARGPETPSGARSTSPGDPARGTQLAKALQRDLGLTAAQASGVVGNLMRESGLRSDIEEAGGGGGYGLAQWTGPRRTALESFARERGASPGDFETQYQFLLHELRGPESRALASLRTASTPEQAAHVFDRDFERSGVKAMDERTANARVVFDRLQQPA